MCDHTVAEVVVPGPEGAPDPMPFVSIPWARVLSEVVNECVHMAEK